MRLLLLSLFLFANLFAFVPGGAVHAQGDDQLTPEKIDGQSAILIDGTTGTVLFEKDPDVPMYPASITKIATGIYAIENGNPDDIVTVSKRARSEEGTRVYLAEGEQVTLRKLEYGLLMNSGNDSATAIAEHLAGSNEAFAEKLNEFLKEKVGVTKTHFTNPHGLHDPNHYTTASDMAKIARYAMKNLTFREIVATKTLPWDGKEWKTTIVNHNRLLWDYEGATGIKNGFTDEAMHTLVISAKRGDTELIAVTLKASSKQATYHDTMSMLDYGFAHYETKKVADAGESYTMKSVLPDQQPQIFYTDEPLFVTAPKGEKLETEAAVNGDLIVRGDSGFTATLPLKQKQQPVVQAAPQPAKQGKVSLLPHYLLFSTWLLLNLLLVAYTYLRVKRRQRERLSMKAQLHQMHRRANS
ncbi:D-alanyl-D-alanine carboxypeptidase family protein [Brevibacillus massiliensis]|uniref:D-alanyl-D-alanine carboxypeptidase family protein n=1 Tax=Brevibacillus massiliensis TaxID=1118054 RepID=UPI000316939C|nr:D-alanyl-D-alanine carboxypeptidase family protein [Brevibacillus massiliensis]